MLLESATVSNTPPDRVGEGALPGEPTAPPPPAPVAGTAANLAQAGAPPTSGAQQPPAAAPPGYAGPPPGYAAPPPGYAAPPPGYAAPPPPPPPPGPAFGAGAQAKALFSQLDPTGVRPTAIVAGIIFSIFFGAQLLNALTPVSAVGPGNPGPGGPGPVGPGPLPTSPAGPASTPLPPGSTLTVGPLRIPLENGWVPQEVPGSNIIVRLTKGSVAIDLFSASIQGQADAAAVYNSFIQSLQQDATGLGATQPNVVQIGNGQLGARGSYTGVFGQNQVEGEVTTLVVGGTQGFIFDVWAGAGTLRTLLPEAQRMIDNVQVGG